MGCDPSKTDTLATPTMFDNNSVSFNIMKKRENLILKQFKNILNHIHDGIIIKAADRNQIFLSNKTADSIMNVSEQQNGLESDLKNILNLKRFSKIDLKEDKHPLFGIYEDEEKSDTVGNKVSLNTIVKNLENSGDHGFSESSIYKVSMSRKV